MASAVDWNCKKRWRPLLTGIVKKMESAVDWNCKIDGVRCRCPGCLQCTDFLYLLLKQYYLSSMSQRGPNLTFIDYTQRRTIVGTTSLDEWLARRRDNTQHDRQTDNHSPGGVRTHNSWRRADADLRLRSRGHCDPDRPVLPLLIHPSISSSLYILAVIATKW